MSYSYDNLHGFPASPTITPQEQAALLNELAMLESELATMTAPQKTLPTSVFARSMAAAPAWMLPPSPAPVQPTPYHQPYPQPSYQLDDRLTRIESALTTLARPPPPPPPIVGAAEAAAAARAAADRAAAAEAREDALARQLASLQRALDERVAADQTTAAAAAAARAAELAELRAASEAAAREAAEAVAAEMRAKEEAKAKEKKRKQEAEAAAAAAAAAAAEAEAAARARAAEETAAANAARKVERKAVAEKTSVNPDPIYIAVSLEGALRLPVPPPVMLDTLAERQASTFRQQSIIIGEVDTTVEVYDVLSCTIISSTTLPSRQAMVSGQTLANASRALASAGISPARPHARTAVEAVEGAAPHCTLESSDRRMLTTQATARVGTAQALTASDEFMLFDDRPETCMTGVHTVVIPPLTLPNCAVPVLRISFSMTHAGTNYPLCATIAPCLRATSAMKTNKHTWSVDEMAYQVPLFVEPAIFHGPQVLEAAFAINASRTTVRTSSLLAVGRAIRRLANKTALRRTSSSAPPPRPPPPPLPPLTPIAGGRLYLRLGGGDGQAVPPLPHTADLTDAYATVPPLAALCTWSRAEGRKRALGAAGVINAEKLPVSLQRSLLRMTPSDAGTYMNGTISLVPPPLRPSALDLEMARVSARAAAAQGRSYDLRDALRITVPAARLLPDGIVLLRARAFITDLAGRPLTPAGNFVTDITCKAAGSCPALSGQSITVPLDALPSAAYLRVDVAGVEVVNRETGSADMTPGELESLLNGLHREQSVRDGNTLSSDRTTWAQSPFSYRPTDEVTEDEAQVLPLNYTAGSSVGAGKAPPKSHRRSKGAIFKPTPTSATTPATNDFVNTGRFELPIYSSAGQTDGGLGQAIAACKTVDMVQLAYDCAPRRVPGGTSVLVAVDMVQAPETTATTAAATAASSTVLPSAEPVTTVGMWSPATALMAGPEYVAGLYDARYQVPLPLPTSAAADIARRRAVQAKGAGSPLAGLPLGEQPFDIDLNRIVKLAFGPQYSFPSPEPAPMINGRIVGAPGMAGTLATLASNARGVAAPSTAPVTARYLNFSTAPRYPGDSGFQFSPARGLWCALVFAGTLPSPPANTVAVRGACHVFPRAGDLGDSGSATFDYVDGQAATSGGFVAVTPETTLGGDDTLRRPFFRWAYQRCPPALLPAPNEDGSWPHRVFITVIVDALVLRKNNIEVVPMAWGVFEAGDDRGVLVTGAHMLPLRAGPPPPALAPTLARAAEHPLPRGSSSDLESLLSDAGVPPVSGLGRFGMGAVVRVATDRGVSSDSAGMGSGVTVDAALASAEGMHLHPPFTEKPIHELIGSLDKPTGNACSMAMSRLTRKGLSLYTADGHRAERIGEVAESLTIIYAQTVAGLANMDPGNVQLN